MGSDRNIFAAITRVHCKLYCLFFLIFLVLLISTIAIVVTVFKLYDRYFETDSLQTTRIFLDQYNQPFSWQSTRLPRWFAPIENKLQIETKDQKEWRNSFYISNEITFDVIEKSKLLVLHYGFESLQAQNISCFSKGTNRSSSSVKVVNTRFSEGVLDMYAFQLSRTLKPQEQCTITLFGEGTMGNFANGLYFDEYVHTKLSDDLETETSYALVTQLEPTLARKVFPCFDEPNFKAKFSLVATFYVDIFDFVLFNTPMLSEFDHSDGKRKTMRFSATVLMPTYVVGIIFGKNYHYASVKAEETELRDYPVIHTIYYPMELEPYAKEPLQLAVDTMLYFEKAFGIAFPMEKCDHFPIRYMNMGGMENWGLITYLLSKLLYKSEDSGIKPEVARANLVAHEMAHQWFGNLVTLEWWDELWLNEGFARFMESIALESVRPQYRALERFYNDGTIFRTLYYDALQTTHPIHTGSDSGHFDEITYTKGSAVLFMLENFIGPDAFLAGVGQYLRKYEYGNAKSEDLWQMLTSVSNKSYGDLSSVMDKWINYKHTPIVTVNFDDDYIYLEQTVFCFTCNASAVLTPWSIPLTYAFSDDTTGDYHTYMFDQLREKIPLVRPKPDWIKFNINGTGLYRVKYQNEHAFQAFAQTIKEQPGKIPYMDRGNLMIDALALAKLGHVSYSEALEFVTIIIDHEDSAGALKMAFDFSFGLVDLFQRLKRTGYELVAQSYVSKYLGKFYPGLDANEWPAEEEDFNTFILSTLCEFGYPQCLQDCSQLLLETVEANGQIYIHPSVKDIFFPTVAQYGSLSQWEYLYVEAMKGRQEDFNIYHLWKSPDANLIKRFLSEQFFAGTSIEVTAMMMNALVQSSRGNLPGALIAWDLVKTHWDAIYNKFGQFDFLAEGVDLILLNFDTPGQLNDVILAGETLSSFESNSMLMQGKETISFNIKWNQLYLYEVVHTLKILMLTQ